MAEISISSKVSGMDPDVSASSIRWYELIWFYDHAPTTLERSADSLSALKRATGRTPDPNLNGSPCRSRCTPG
jgi:hypothetical protein